jgi:sortase (surface protein transpeptidase)
VTRSTVRSFERLLLFAALTLLASVLIPFALVTEPAGAPAPSSAVFVQKPYRELIEPQQEVVGHVPGGSPSTDPMPDTSVQGLRIAIPRLGIDLPLDVGDIGRDVPRPGFAGATPEGVALLFPGSTMPGRGGNSYIYAHARVGMFLALWGARIDDVVTLSRADGAPVRTYRIALVVPRVDPDDTQWLEAGGRERLTLQTSTGPRPTDPRFIAVAYPVD